MTKYIWDSILETGHETIDGQHRQLFAVLNDFVDAGVENDAAKIESTLEFLLGYTIKHFKDEEALQLEYKYPDYNTHKQIHTDFKITASMLTDRFHKEGYSDTLTAEVGAIIADWLVNHIRGDDFAMATFIQSATKG